MPRSFDVSTDLPASVEQVQSAYGDENYWLDRNAALGGSKTLDSLLVDSDGTVTVTITEDLRHGMLPGLLAKVYRGDLNIRSIEKWKPVGGRRVNGEISVAVTGAPGSGRGAGVLEPSGSGSRLKLIGTVEFKVPLVGGRIESYLAREFARGIPNIQRFTATWIGEHV
ncbi:MAG: DUF2505 domain-containing protein [Mycobacterium sp.]|nr:DUF2505 domain-containing protein [Mycobacterium sp.]MBV9720837.1 DUF2505 domain-containing protein [Mycobacterium sp.]